MCCSLFTEKEVEEIHKITLRDVVLNVTNIPSDVFNENPFFFPTAGLFLYIFIYLQKLC